MVRAGTSKQRITTLDRLVLLLPVVMWVAAALITWFLVSRLLIRPLKRLERAVRNYQPGQANLDLPRGPLVESLLTRARQAFREAYLGTADG